MSAVGFERARLQPCHRGVLSESLRALARVDRVDLSFLTTICALAVPSPDLSFAQLLQWRKSTPLSAKQNSCCRTRPTRLIIARRARPSKSWVLPRIPFLIRELGKRRRHERAHSACLLNKTPHLLHPKTLT